MKKQRGFVCPDCMVALKVHKTIRLATGIIWRRRRCPKCDKRVSTYERIGSDTTARHI